MDKVGGQVISEQFNSITPENVLKWESVHPQPDKYNFTPGDSYVAFGEAHGMWIIGHTLVWHNQTPRWVFEDANGKPVDRDTLLKRMHDHIQTVVGRYKGRIKGWDVVNEALNEDGTMRQTQWLKIIGDDYIAKAFEYAHEADPAAELYYNDYSLENEAKRHGAIELIKKLKAQGVPITAVGLQGHDKMDWPTAEQEDATIADFAKLGVKGDDHGTGCGCAAIANAQSNGGCDLAQGAAGEDESVHERIAGRGAAKAGEAVCGFVRGIREASRRGEAGDVLGCAGRGFVAERLAGARADELSFVV